jgi:protein dithiol oxidoreductase (disulfide-forming)
MLLHRFQYHDSLHPRSLKGVYMRKRFGIIGMMLLSLAGLGQASIIASHDYVVLDVPQRQEAKGKIEVIEFFSWGCPHCYDFYPLLNRWLATLPKDIAFKRVSVGFGHPEWDNLTKAYYALQSTGDLARLDGSIFEAIHKEHVSLFDEQNITTWVGKHGVNVAQFTAAYRSFGVNTSVGQAQQTVIDYRVDGIPTLAIGGRYKVSTDHNKMLPIADELIAKVRAEEKKPKK